MKIKRKNDSNRYVVRITHLLDGILYCSLIITLVVFCQFTLFGEWSILDFGEKVMSVLGWFSLPMFIFILIMFIKYPNFIIDFDKEYIIIRKVEYQLKDVIKIEYIKRVTSIGDEIIVYMNNDKFQFKFFNGNGVNIERGRGYPMAKKIEEINNKLQEYRKQNNLD